MRPASAWLLSAGLILTLGGLAGLAWLLFPAAAVELQSAIPQAQPANLALTATPFQPLDGSPSTPNAPNLFLPVLSDQPSTPAEPVDLSGGSLPTAETAPPAHFAAHLLDFPAEKVRLRLFPGPAVNNASPIKIAFVPAADCPFGAGTACISLHRGGQVILATVHSGVKGEGEAFRQAVEGLALGVAGFPLSQVNANLTALETTTATLTLGGETLTGLELAALVRIPPMGLADYYSQPFDDALKRAAQADEQARLALESGQPLLVFEICGWQIIGEPWSSAAGPSSASIYLGFVRQK